MNHFIRTLCLTLISAVFFCTFAITSSNARETIKRFDSLVQVAKDGSFTVTETIVVKAEGRKIKRGIYRDFPLYYEDVNGKRRKVGFDLISVKRDDKFDKTRIENRNNGIRIYIGRKDYFLPKGIYTYTITYKTDGQMRYFENHDEVYWNATGNFWDFPIETVLAQIVLPEGASATDWDVFTGRQGAKGKDATIGKIAGKRVIKYRTTRTLNAREGMTVLAKVDKGVIDPPSEAQISKWWWEDNSAMILGLIGLVLISLYYFFAWWRVGRDLPQGIVVPRWDVSGDMSPALVNYIDQKGLSGKGFDAISSGFLSLATKGLVTLEKKTKYLYITATNKHFDEPLPIGEAILLKRVKLALNNEMAISKSNGSGVKAMQQKFAAAMEKEHRDRFYKHNYMWVILGIVLSIFILIAVLTIGSVSPEALVFVVVSGVVTLFVSIFAFSFAKMRFTPKNLIAKIFNLVITGFMVFTFASAGLTAGVQLFMAAIIEPWPIISVVGIIVLNVLFFFLLGAPTAIGRQKMDEIEGLKTYLTLAEKDRMNMKDAPDFSTTHYEELLPYAVALGVEKPWSKSFETWLAAAVAAGTVAAASYSPNWYRGRDFRSDDLSSSMDGFTSSMQDGFSNAMPVPQSSSSGFSGGGGSSGGGGGGGGGGGW